MFETNFLLIFGVSILFGIAVSRLMDRLSVPHVVGFILLGVVLGCSGLNFLTLDDADHLGLVVDVTLGFIGFGMGEHLHKKELEELGRSIIVISVLESLAAFAIVLVGILVLTNSLPLAIILGSLAAATAPAATVDVLKQYKSKGPLTTTLLAVIGIDDAIALLLYSITVPFAISLLSSSTGFGLYDLLLPVFEIAGSVLLGFASALIVNSALGRKREKEEALLIMIGSVLLVSGIALSAHMSVILSCLVFGAVTINLNRSHSQYIAQTIDRVGPVLYIIFFVLVGSRLEISYLPHIGLIGLAYLLLRAAGKLAGAYAGARLSNAQEVVRKYLGIGLLSQAGVAVGLALSFSARVAELGPAGLELQHTIITTIIASTLLIQVIGPILTKRAIFRAGEVTDPDGSFFG